MSAEPPLNGAFILRLVLPGTCEAPKKNPGALAGAQLQAVFAGDGGKLLPGDENHIGTKICEFKLGVGRG